MTRKHFKALAEAFKDVKPSSNWANKLIQWEMDCIAVADVCARQNSQFDRAKFLTACGLK